MKHFLRAGCGLLLTAAIFLSVLTGCGGKKPNPSDSTESDAPVSEDLISDWLAGDVTDISGEESSDPASDPTNSPTVSRTNSSSGSKTSDPANSNSGTAVSADYYVNSTGKTFQNMSFSYKAPAAVYNVNDQITVQDLGKMQLEEYPLDGVYDSAFNIIKVGDVYRMWWCRANPFDTIWYAESKDMKNWYNAQCVIDLNGYSTTYIKEMMAWSSVLYVDGKYHMFFEAPAKIADSGEYSNNIFYATSKNGIDWTFYPNNKDPKPVIVNPVVKEGVYGVGQPKAFYKDGYFYVVYTDASAGGGDIRVARSKGNGFSFEGTVATHTKLISGVAGAAVRYNEITKKYYMVFTASETQADGKYNDNIYMMESDDLYNWPCTTRAQALSKACRLSDTKVVSKKGNADFVTNELGIVTDDNMCFVYMEGVMPSQSEDHRNTHTTWDGHLAVLGVGSQYNKTLTLPNGKAATAANLKWYYDKVAAWTRPTVDAAQGAAEIDGTKDAIYNSGGTAKVETVTWSYENCKPTDTTGTVSFAWDQEALYVYASIKDDTGPYTNAVIEKPANLWRNDSITVFIDVPDQKTGTTNSETLTPLTFSVIIDASGKYVVKDSSETDVSTEFAGLITSTKKVSGGYVIEAKIPWHAMVKDQIRTGKTVGLDVQINDSFGTEAGREAQVYWSDYTGNAFLYLDRFGQLLLK